MGDTQQFSLADPRRLLDTFPCEVGWELQNTKKKETEESRMGEVAAAKGCHSRPLWGKRGRGAPLVEHLLALRVLWFLPPVISGAVKPRSPAILFLMKMGLLAIPGFSRMSGCCQRQSWGLKWHTS